MRTPVWKSKPSTTYERIKLRLARIGGWSALRTRLKRYKKGLTVMSAVIVFMSFTVKEEVGEYLKEQVARLNEWSEQSQKRAAQKVEEWRFIRLLRTLQQTQEILRGLNRPAEQIWQQTVDVEIYDLHNGETLQDADIVTGISSRRDYYRQNIKAIGDKENDLFIELNKIRTKSEVSPAERQRVRQIEAELGRLNTEVINLLSETWREVNQRKRTLEEAMAITKWGVYVFFIFGWTLGLGLSLLGKNPRSEGE